MCLNSNDNQPPFMILPFKTLTVAILNFIMESKFAFPSLFLNVLLQHILDQTNCLINQWSSVSISRPE